MFVRSTRHRSLVAMAGLTAGVASVVVGSTAVNAQSIAAQDTAVDPDAQATPASHGTCFSWTTVLTEVGQVRTHVNVPTTARDNNERHCTLREGNETHGVFKLQDAINKCYPELSAGVGADGIYGPRTREAVRHIQERVRVTPDGIYGPDTKTAMRWPHYLRGTLGFIDCRLLRA